MKTTIQSDFALTELRPSLTLVLLWDVISVWTCLCIYWNWGFWNAASKSIKLIVLSGCLLMYLVSCCSWEDHLFLRYDLWNVTWRQQYNLTLPLWATTKPDPGVVMRCYECLDLSLHLLELRVLTCSLQVDQVDRLVRMLADVSCEQL